MVGTFKDLGQPRTDGRQRRSIGIVKPLDRRRRRGRKKKESRGVARAAGGHAGENGGQSRSEVQNYLQEGRKDRPEQEKRKSIAGERERERESTMSERR